MLQTSLTSRKVILIWFACPRQFHLFLDMIVLIIKHWSECSVIILCEQGRIHPLIKRTLMDSNWILTLSAMQKSHGARNSRMRSRNRNHDADAVLCDHTSTTHSHNPKLPCEYTDALALFISLRQETAVIGVNTKSLAYLSTSATRLQTHQSKRSREAQTVVRPLTHLSHPFLSLYAGIIMTYL